MCVNAMICSLSCRLIYSHGRNGTGRYLRLVVLGFQKTPRHSFIRSHPQLLPDHQVLLKPIHETNIVIDDHLILFLTLMQVSFRNTGFRFSDHIVHPIDPGPVGVHRSQSARIPEQLLQQVPALLLQMLLLVILIVLIIVPISSTVFDDPQGRKLSHVTNPFDWLNAGRWRGSCATSTGMPTSCAPSTAAISAHPAGTLSSCCCATSSEPPSWTTYDFHFIKDCCRIELELRLIEPVETRR